jgi:glucose/arabinose dehydrogenase
MKKISYLIICSLVTGCITVEKPKQMTVPSDSPLAHIELPAGFNIDYFAQNVPDARSICLSPEGVLFVGTFEEGKVYALIDKNQDFKVDTVLTLVSNLNMPNGVALKNGNLYIAEVNRISVIENIHQNLYNPPAPTTIYDRHHGWKYIAFGPDGLLYVPVGGPCNVCERDNPVYSSITRIDVDGGTPEIIAKGVRNSVGFAWHPETGEMWFTDNGRDMLGDEVPGDELNHLKILGSHFGFPYCHQGNILDPKFGEGKNCEDYTPPAQVLGPHVAALGVEFYTGSQFPNSYNNSMLIAEHGSWNRTDPIGYRLVHIALSGDSVISYSPFAEGWLKGGETSGRPVDIETMPDGSILVSDDFSGVIYRISYSGSME